MMRSRTIREGSVGLLILVGMGLFGLLLLWLRGLSPGTRSYTAIVEFENVVGMQPGAPVRYRGVRIGRILEIRPGVNAVDVVIEVIPATVVIPRQNLIVEANQSGLIGETSIDITPGTAIPPSVAVAANPLASDCNNTVIVCDGARLQGVIGVSFDALIRSTVEFTDLFADPNFFADIRTLTRNTSEAAAGVAALTREVTDLTQSVEQELGTLSTAAASSAISVGQAANQVGLTAAQVNNLLTENRTTLVTTLDNINQASVQLQVAVGQLSPTIAGGQGLVQDLQLLSANAVQASLNLRNLTESVGSAENVLLLQQTLESARATFQNAQKITSDLDELTGDPSFRQNLRQLIDGLSGLVSSTEHLQQQTAIAQVLAPAETALESADPVTTPVTTSVTTSVSAPITAEAPDRPVAVPNFPLQPTQLTLLDPSYNVRVRPFVTTSPTQAELQ